MPWLSSDTLGKYSEKISLQGDKIFLPEASTAIFYKQLKETG